MRVARFWNLALIPAFAFSVACSEDSASNEDDLASAINEVPEVPACGAKCDSPTSNVRLIKALTMNNYAFDDATGEESFRFVGDVADEFYFDVMNGYSLEATVTPYGDEAPAETAVSLPLVFEEDGLGGFITETYTGAELLPRAVLHVRIKGEFLGKAVDQLWAFEPGVDEGFEPDLTSTDPWADAKNVDLPLIIIDPDLEVPDYAYPQSEGFRLSGTEFWQKWPEGLNPTYSYTAGTDAGRKCMYASARRFEAIMADPPQALVDLRENSNWSGSFFNWNDDFSADNANGSARGAVLWAWRTSLVKWISQTGKDGYCYLPTKEMVAEAADNCQRRGDANGGEIQGCQSY
ncbi:MAG: hypothetical protein R3E66_06385 [bacterium]